MTSRILDASDRGTAAAPQSGAARPLMLQPVPDPATALETDPVSPAAALPRSTPVRIRIPAIGVSAPIGTVGLEDDGTVGTPPIDHPNTTGWYKHGPTPGEAGPAVILGHVDTTTGPAVFARLRQLLPGDAIEITRRDGSTVTFIVEGIEKAPKRNFPTGRVYGALDHAGLRLITCGGDFDTRARSYTDNVIVYAAAR
ncbi:class F sortase [Planomonospora sp. ID67723]|nr:class F sortase [Planomonospora sp. ID67723]